ncbi:MAG: VanZ family protein [Isosphaeraceae bacterium]
MKERRRVVPSVTALLFVGYLLFFLDMTLRWYPKNHPAPNLTPFRSMQIDWTLGGRHLVVNFIGNIVAFLPFGVLLGRMLGPKASALRVTALAAGLSAAVELTQYLSGRRVADVDDVILNGLGALLGYLILLGFRRRQAPR